jgi:hypothetical protein
MNPFLVPVLAVPFALASFAHGPSLALPEQSAPQKPLTPRVASASLFKNGYTVVMREVPVSQSGDLLIESLPPVINGTLWLIPTEGIVLKSAAQIKTTTEEESPANSLDEILNANVGKRLEFSLSDKRTLSGVLLGMAGPFVVISEGPQSQRAVMKSAITEVASPEGALVWRIVRKVQTSTLRVTLEATKPGKLFILSLERGMTWAPAYSVDISDARRLRLTAKATLLNDLADLNQAEVRLVTGFPNLPFLNILDPLTSGQTLDQFVSALLSWSAPGDFRARGGGFAMQARAAEAAAPEPIPGLPSEDLFFYYLKNVTLKKGDRAYYVLLSSESEYQHVYETVFGDTLQGGGGAPPEEPNDVWHTVKFKNTSGQPLTTAIATIVKNGEVMGQDTLPYTSAGGEVTVKMSKALDVRAESTEEEVARQRNALEVERVSYDLVTVRGTIRIKNFKSEEIKLEVRKFLMGFDVQADNAGKITALATALRAVNPQQKIEWALTVKPGEEKTLTYSFKVYITR